jgi:hypothetical protein
MDRWQKVYDLADDQDRIVAARQTTASPGVFGLAPGPAPFGSADWWQSIEDGQIVKHSVSGVIVKLYMTGHGDWPQFDLEGDGVKTSWTRLGDQSAYREGREARVDYVELKTKNVLLGKTHQRCVLKIWMKTRAGAA